MPVNPSARYAEAGPDFAPSSGAFASHRAQAKDDVLAFLLIHTWTLITGRVLRSDVPPTELSEDELIAFWADDHIAPTGSPVLGVHQTA
jgi:hypothetical protein